MSDPLYNHALERAATGALISESAGDFAGAMVAVQQHPLTEAEFHLPANWALWSVAAKLLAENQPASELLVFERLKASNPEALEQLGGLPGLMKLTGSGTLTIHQYPGFVRQLRDLGLRRRMKATADKVAEQAINAVDVNDALSLGASAWAALANQGPSTRDGRKVFESTLHDLDEAQAGRMVSTIPTGIDLWDQVLGGLQSEKVNFILAQPSVGKTALVATMIRNLARTFAKDVNGATVGVFSAEDRAEAFTRRWLADDAAVPLKLLGRVKLYAAQMQRISEASDRMWKWLPNVLFDDRSLLTGPQLVQTAREWVMTRGARVIFIDHFGKLDHQAGDHHRDDLARAQTLNHLTALAKECRIPVVVLVHDKSRDKDAKYLRPSDTGGAGAAAIERDARVMVGLYLQKETEREELWCAVLKQTEGERGDDFAIRFRIEAGLVESTGNGVVDDSRTVEQERRMLERQQIASSWIDRIEPHSSSDTEDA